MTQSEKTDEFPSLASRANKEVDCFSHDSESRVDATVRRSNHKKSVPQTPF